MKQRIWILVIFLCLCTGCATTQTPSKLSELQIQVNQLERRAEERDKEIEDLKFQVSNLSTQLEGENNYSFNDPVEDLDVSQKSATIRSTTDENIIRVAASVQDVQKALKGAGYYSGSIDGKLGSGSKQAIREFQKDHNLKADGIVGKGTWAELKSYL